MADVFSFADQKQLFQLMATYAPQGIDQLKSDVRKLNAEVSEAKTQAGKDAVRRAFWATHKPCIGSDADAITSLHRKACQCGEAESGADATLLQAQRQGLISQSECNERIHSERVKQRDVCKQKAYDLLTALGDLGKHVTFASTASDTDLKRAMDSFAKTDAWLQTLDRFSQVWDASDAATRAELRARHPELCESIGR